MIKSAHNRLALELYRSASAVLRHRSNTDAETLYGACMVRAREAADRGFYTADIELMARRKKKRPFTVEEVTEVQRLVRKCFRGDGSHDDSARAEALWKINPDEYKTISEEVRQEERDLLRSGGF